MAPNRRKVVASRHLVCGNCSSWIQFESSGDVEEHGRRLEGRVLRLRARGAQR